MAKSDRRTAAREAARARKAAREAADATGHAAAAVLKDRWERAVAALSAAEMQLEEQVRTIMKERKLTGRDAAAALAAVRKRLERERKSASKQLHARFARLQSSARKQGKALGRAAGQTAQRALASLSIPTREDLGRLTTRVEELAHRLEGLRSRRRRR
jgi:hypothetical protein